MRSRRLIELDRQIDDYRSCGDIYAFLKLLEKLTPLEAAYAALRIDREGMTEGLFREHLEAEI